MPCGRLVVELNTVDSDCIALTGNGTTVPFEATPIIPATIPYPLLATTLPNGLTCEADGLHAVPERYPSGWAADLGIGSLPTIVADTAPGPGPAGSIAWGPRLEYAITNLDPDRASVNIEFRSFPGISAVLDPGAEVSVFYTLYAAALNAPPATMTPFFTNIQWQINNTSPGGPSLQTFTSPRESQSQITGAFAPATPTGSFEWRGIQMWILTTGFGASSAVSATFAGLGQGSQGMVIPV